MTAWADVFIAALLPLTALFVVLQTRPYFALISRGILGAAAVLLYAVLGAPDVALTEALVGTLLTVILYAIAVRSTRVLRVGRRVGDAALETKHPLRQFCARHRLVLRTFTFPDEAALAAALVSGRVDAVHVPCALLAQHLPAAVSGRRPDEAVTFLAPHGRWHERGLHRLFGDDLPVVRLGPAATERNR